MSKNRGLKSGSNLAREWLASGSLEPLLKGGVFKV